MFPIYLPNYTQQADYLFDIYYNYYGVAPFFTYEWRRGMERSTAEATIQGLLLAYVDKMQSLLDRSV